MDAENLVAPIKDLLAGQEFADDMGADAYGKDALDCVAVAKGFVSVQV